MPNPLVLPILNWARKLKHPTLFKITAGLLVLSVLFPDPIPFIDEIVLGLGTLMLANWKKRRDDPAVAGDSDAIDGSATRR